MGRHRGLPLRQPMSIPANIKGHELTTPICSINELALQLGIQHLAGLLFGYTHAKTYPDNTRPQRRPISMLKQSVQDAINEQIKNEFYSAYIYLSVSAYFDTINLMGFSNWMRMQSREEVSHGMKLFDFIIDRGGRVALQAIDKPPVEFKSPLDVMQQALDHERRVTGMIERLYELAGKE